MKQRFIKITGTHNPKRLLFFIRRRRRCDFAFAYVLHFLCKIHANKKEEIERVEANQNIELFLNFGAKIQRKVQIGILNFKEKVKRKKEKSK